MLLTTRVRILSTIIEKYISILEVKKRGLHLLGEKYEYFLQQYCTRACGKLNDMISMISNQFLLTSRVIIVFFLRLEISKIRKAQLLRALNMAMDFASQNIISCITFTTYVMLGNSLTAAKVFSSIAFLNALQRSVTRHFPPAVQKLSEAKITVRRIQVSKGILLIIMPYYSLQLQLKFVNLHVCTLELRANPYSNMSRT